jgi:hypothetical protein
MVILTDVQILALLSMLIFASAGACAGLGAGTKTESASMRFLTSSCGFEVAAGFLFLSLVTSEPGLGIGSLLGGGVGIYQAFKGDKNGASQSFGWLVFLSSVVLAFLVVVSLEILFK